MGSPRYLELVAQAHSKTLDDVIGRAWQEVPLLASTEDAVLQWNTVLKDRTSFRQPELAVSFAPDGQETVWDYSLTPILDTQDPSTVSYMLVAAVEITEQAQARKDLEQLEHLRDDFLSLATHELRFPLTSIQANTQMLQRTLKRHIASLGQEQAHEQRLDQGLTQIEHILHQLGNMNSLITEMLDVTRLQGEVFELHPQENVDLVALIRRVVEQQGTQSHRITVESSENSIRVILDEDRIEQVLNNLLSNAIKYSPISTSIEVTIEQHLDVNEVVVGVCDEGDGILEDDQRHIFERFYRVKTTTSGHIDGLGLGLYIAYGVIKQHGGRMWLESHPSQGSTFFFALPLPPT
jgi:two-component system CheB/CheR fusion protein